MPIYEYICNQCGHELEALQKLSDVALIECPACARPALKKRISAAGFRLSGSGWYETDFKSERQKNLAKSDTSAKDGAGKKGKDEEKKSADSGKATDAKKNGSAKSEAAA